MRQHTISSPQLTATYPHAVEEDIAHACLMAERFFPRYIRRVGQAINLVHKVNPSAGCKLNMKALSIAVRRKLKLADLAFYRSGKRQMHTCGQYRYFTYNFGKGPAVLLIHGWCSDGSRWQAYVQQLTRMGFQSVVMDAPSHGQSPGRTLSVPGYIACIEQVITSKKHWHAAITHSMGSLTGVVAASHVSQKANVDRFVLMNTFADCDALMSKFSRCLGVSEKVLSDTRSWIKHYSGKPLDYFTLKRHLTEMKMPPTLLIADKDDIVVPHRETQRILENLSYIQHYLTSGLGHNLWDDQVTQKVLNFVGR